MVNLILSPNLKSARLTAVEVTFFASEVPFIVLVLLTSMLPRVTAFPYWSFATNLTKTGFTTKYLASLSIKALSVT